MDEPVPMRRPTRPVLRWHGGKWKLAPWILSFFPPHRVYVEPFGGAASILIRKERSYAEVYNDLDGEVVNLFRVLRDGPAAARLVADLELTPFARAEFEGAYLDTEDDVERARRLCIRSIMGFGSNGHNIRVKTGFRANSNRSGTVPSGDWRNYPEILPDIIDRLRGVTIENRDAVECMRQHDSLETLHYVDPPYLPETRSLANPYDLKYRGGKGTAHRAGMYTHEMAAEDHAGLLGALPTLTGMVILSGYPHAMYDDALPDWERHEAPAFADGARPRTEVLWLNPACGAARRAAASQPSMFDTLQFSEGERGTG